MFYSFVPSPIQSSDDEDDEKNVEIQGKLAAPTKTPHEVLRGYEYYTELTPKMFAYFDWETFATMKADDLANMDVPRFLLHRVFKDLTGAMPLSALALSNPLPFMHGPMKQVFDASADQDFSTPKNGRKSPTQQVSPVVFVDGGDSVHGTIRFVTREEVGQPEDFEQGAWGNSDYLQVPEGVRTSSSGQATKGTPTSNYRENVKYCPSHFSKSR